METSLKKIAYTVNKLIKDIRKNNYIDYDRNIIIFEKAYFYFTALNNIKAAKIAVTIKKLLKRKELVKDDLLCNLLRIRKFTNKNIEKTKIMDIRRVESLIDYHEMINKKKKSGLKAEAIEKYDTIYAPTQGGGHLCVVYDIMENGMALCYPFTTASEEDLKILGNKTWDFKECSVDGFKLMRLSSCCTLIDINDAGYFKKNHIYQHDEIDQAVNYFQEDFKIS